MQDRIKAGNFQHRVEKWGFFELALTGPSHGNPFLDVTLRVRMSCGSHGMETLGFYDGDGSYKVRFMPDREGVWHFETESSSGELNGITGSFECVAPTGDNHGPVRVCHTYHFAYADGERYVPVGTTCYAWTHQAAALQEMTLKTLKHAPFNKMRMCEFPKYYDFNKKEPILYPYERKESGEWDFTRFNPVFFQHLEKCIEQLLALGIQADIILFHPYDRWGFSSMGRDMDELYLRYLIARIGAYRNVWWSLANEYDLLNAKTEEDWERIAVVIAENDPYRHLCSIHNGARFYDYAKPWITHCSLQRIDLYKTAENTDVWREQFQKPIVIDECAYEGNVQHGWGNISGQEMTRRFWEGAVRGGYVGHGETYMHPEDILWWSHGGELHGTSPERIAFLRQVLEEGPAEGITPLTLCWDAACGGKEGEYYLVYFGFNQPSFRDVVLPEGIRFKVEVIDTWGMTITPVEGVHEKWVRVQLPGVPYMALRLTKAE